MAILNTIAQFGSYRLRTRLAQANACDVWLADVDGAPPGSPPVIVKRLRREFAEHPEVLERFERRAHATLRLTHENVNTTLDVVRIEGEIALCQPYLDGKTLRQVLTAVGAAGNSLPVWFAVHVARCICRALDYAHSRTNSTGVLSPIIHYNLGANNVFLTYEGNVKVCDFGTNSLALGRSDDDVPVASSRTAQGGPESKRLREGQSPIRDDLEGIGQILYELLTGNSSSAPLDCALDFVPPSHHAPWVNAEVDQILRRVLSRSYPNRVHTAAELGRILDDYSRALCHNVTATHLAGLVTVLFSNEAHDSAPPTTRFDEGASKLAQLRSRRTTPPEGTFPTGFEHSAPTRPGLLMPTSASPTPHAKGPGALADLSHEPGVENVPARADVKPSPFHHDWDLALKHAREQSQTSSRSSGTFSTEPNEPPAKPPTIDPCAQALVEFEKGLECRQRGDLDGALIAWERALELDPQHRICRANLNLIKKKLNRS